MSSKRKKTKTEVIDPEAQRVAEEYQKNISSVMFTPASTKNVCSPHSGSILGGEGPVVPLSDEQRERIDKIFDSGDEFRQSDIQDLLCKSFGYVSYAELDMVVRKVYGKDFDPDGPLSAEDFSSFLTLFQCPSYYYGQRLRRSAGRGLVEETRELIVRGCDPNTADGEGLNALHYAAEFNCVAIIQAIAEMTAPMKGLLLLDARCKYGWTPLYCAAHHGNIDCVEVLLRLGANPFVCNNVGKSPLHAAAAQGRSVICDLLMEAARTMSSDKGQRSAPSGPLLALADKHGMTPLHEAAYKGQEKIYHHLAKSAGADPAATDVMRNIPADYFKKIHVVH